MTPAEKLDSIIYLISLGASYLVLCGVLLVLINLARPSRN